MEDIPVTIVGIKQNSLINGPTNRSSLTACLHEGGGGGGGGWNIVVTFSRCMLGIAHRYTSPMANKIMPTS